MRWLLGFALLLLALGAVRLVGCGDEPEGPQRCETDEECDDQNECTRDVCNRGGSCEHFDSLVVECDFNGVDEATEDGLCVRGELVCEKNPCDDGNECTYDSRTHPEVPCEHEGCIGCRPCDWNGEPGVCFDGVCQEDPCAGVDCDDDNVCTAEYCRDGECVYYASGNGEWCSTNRICIDGVCEEDVCLELVCDDGNLCTDDECDSVKRMCVYPARCRDRPCEYGSCDPTNGSCHYEVKPDGSSCYPYRPTPCFGTYSCRSGLCVCGG